MFSFRQKIFLSYLIGFFIFLIAIFPLSAKFVRYIVESAMRTRSEELITRIRDARDDEELVKLLKDQKSLLFFRVSVITNEKKILYDSHTKRLLGEEFSQEYIVEHPEVEQAFKYGVGYQEAWSTLLEQKFAYLATAFNFHGKTYVLRTAFPYHYVSEIQDEFELGFISIATLVLLASTLMSWLILNHFTRPIRRIVEAVRPFQEGKSDLLPLIEKERFNPKDEFSFLAETLNSLNWQIQEKLNSLKAAGIEKEILLESLTEGVIAVNAQGKVTFINQSALNLFGGTKDKYTGFTLDDLGHKEASDLSLKSQNEGVVLSGSLELKRRGKTAYLNLTAAPKTDGSGVLLVLQDTTKEVGILEMRKEFIANASHELKTPITIIQGFAEMLHDNPDLSDDSRGEITAKIVRNCNRMESLVRDLLALADIEHLPESRLSDFDLFEVIERAKQMTEDLYPDAHVEILGNRPLSYKGDPDLMEMALFNLINNAAKYSIAPAEVVVKGESKEEEIVIEVKDKGIGIPPSDLPHLFERFYRVDKAESQKKGGSGLGLSIVKTVVAKHGGTIEVVSTPGQGSCFTIHLFH